jgi:hypothetical protein
MMELVVPLPVEPIAAGRERTNHANIVEIAFGDDPGLPSEALCPFVKTLAKLR